MEIYLVLFYVTSRRRNLCSCKPTIIHSERWRQWTCLLWTLSTVGRLHIAFLAAHCKVTFSWNPWRVKR